jgi:hypothetical protein
LFSSPAGENVLLWILTEHHVFNRNIKTDAELQLRNWGMKLLSGFMQMAMAEDKTEGNE